MRTILLTVITCFMIEAAPRPLQRVAFSSDEVVTVDVDRVNLQFSVTNRKGKLITNLKREHFNIFEDDQPQSITNFSTETDLPLNIALLFDTSGSLHDKLRFEQNAAAQFLYSSLRRGRDQALIMTFDTTISLLHDYTDDPADSKTAPTQSRSPQRNDRRHGISFSAVHHSTPCEVIPEIRHSIPRGLGSRAERRCDMVWGQALSG